MKSANQGTKSRAHDYWQRKATVLRFALPFVAYMAVYYIVALTPWFDSVLYQTLRLDAGLACRILNLVGIDCVVHDVAIRSARFSVNVRRGCDAVEPAWIFCAAVLSVPASFGRKLVGMVLGFLILSAVNVVRVASLFVIGQFAHSFFSTAHLEVWPIALIILAGFLFLCWITWIRTDRA